MPNNSLELFDNAPLAFFPLDHGLISWDFDPTYGTSTYTLATAGTLYAAQVKVNPGVITNVVYEVTTAGGTLTSGQCFAGIYQNGNLLGSSADQATAWASTGLKTTALASPVTVQQGVIYVTFSFNGTTGPTLAAASARGNRGLAGTASRYATGATGATTALPAAFGTVAALAASPWVAVS
jgi:hypothetical protein